MNTLDSTPEFTILLPCLNEQETLPFCIREIRAFLSHAHISAEILVADNGSTDDSAQLARSLGARVVRVPKQGYGNALLGGIQAASGQYIIMGDCDYSYDFSKLEPFIEALQSGYDFVIGNRFSGTMEKHAMQNPTIKSKKLRLIFVVIKEKVPHTFGHSPMVLDTCSL